MHASPPFSKRVGDLRLCGLGRMCGAHLQHHPGRKADREGGLSLRALLYRSEKRKARPGRPSDHGVCHKVCERRHLYFSFFQRYRPSGHQDRAVDVLAHRVCLYELGWADQIEETRAGKADARRAVRRGQGVLPGDFYAEAATSVQGRTVSSVWNIKTVRNDYGNTSTALKASFPNLASIPTENRMIGR